MNFYCAGSTLDSRWAPNQRESPRIEPRRGMPRTERDRHEEWRPFNWRRGAAKRRPVWAVLRAKRRKARRRNKKVA